MKQIGILGLLILLLYGCSSSSKKTNEVISADDNSWIYEPQKACLSTEICASGEGKNQEEADINARKSIAGIFETKINAKFEYTKQSIDNSEISEMKETVVDQVNAQVDQILKGVTIKKRFERNELIFSLAVLDKMSSSNVLRQEISKIDDELNHYISLKNRIYLKKLISLYNKREILNEKLILIVEAGIPRRVRFSQIKALKYDQSTIKKISLRFTDSTPNTLKMKTQASLTDVGFKVVTEGNHDFQLSGEYEVKEEYLNVKGFKKYTFNYFLESKNTNGKKLGSINLMYTSNGRSEKNAFLKVRKNLLDDIDANLDKLNLDMR
jgi:hypothetical protein